MSKYIDAEKLEAALARHYAEITIPVLTDEGGIESYIRRNEIHVIQRIIDSLTQEQSDKESLNESQQEFVNTVTERMLKEGPIPILKGKQKAEFEKEFNRFKQITGMINFPAHMEVYKRVILWFMAWGADNLPNLNKATCSDELDFQQEQPEVDLEKEYKEYVEDDPVFSILTNRNVGFAIACHFYELGQIEMRHRITNPEYNAKVVEQLKSEYPARKEEK